MLVPKYRQTLKLRGAIHVAKFRMVDGEMRPDGDAYGENAFLLNGLELVWKLVIGAGEAPLNQAEAQIGVGNSDAPVQRTQRDLQGGLKFYQRMDPGFPRAIGTEAIFKATFGPAEANCAWNEFVVRRMTGGICLDRGISGMGVKTNKMVWAPEIRLSFVE